MLVARPEGNWLATAVSSSSVQSTIHVSSLKGAPLTRALKKLCRAQGTTLLLSIVGCLEIHCKRPHLGRWLAFDQEAEDFELLWAALFLNEFWHIHVFYGKKAGPSWGSFIPRLRVLLHSQQLQLLLCWSISTEPFLMVLFPPRGS